MGTAWLSTKKMPVPIVAPMPIVESWNSPMEPLELAAAGVRAGLRRQLGDRLPAQRLLEK
jgi:hypothetical protein